MSGSQEARLVSRIYDVATDETCLGDALVELAKATNCRTASLEIYSPHTSRFLNGRNPLISSEHAQSYLDYWRHHLPGRRSSAPIPVGKVLRSHDLWDRDRVVKSPFFNDWLRPQGMGGDGRYANVSRASGTVAVLGAFKPFKSPQFDAEQQRMFEIAAHHFAKAVDINVRLRRAEMIEAAVDAFEPAVGYVVVDHEGRLLASHEKTLGQLELWGVMATHRAGDRLSFVDPRMGAMINKATDTHGISSSSGFGLVKDDGSALQVSVIPLRPEATPTAPWLAVQKPAALLRIISPEEALTERIRQVADRYSLTRAEQQIVAEAVKGHGRKAVAETLRLQETTVRTHLSSIFAKMGIRRQAELCQVVLAD